MFNKYKYFIIITVVVSIVLISFLFINPKKNKMDYFPLVNEEIGNINTYYIYGNHFNIFGSLKANIDLEKVNKIYITLNTEQKNIDYEVFYSYQDETLAFNTSKNINEGIFLDNIDIDYYYILLKIDYKNGSYAYYTLNNNTDYESLDYYTLTKNSQNKYIKIGTDKRNENLKDISIKPISYFYLDVSNVKLPNNIYDIVIDPGHGGMDAGAGENYKIKESEQVLEVAKALKTELETLGLKVKLTRDGDYNPGQIKGIDPYGTHARISIPYETKAKYFFSIHINSAEFKMAKGGVEIYTNSPTDTTFAKSIADNIVLKAKTLYSPNEINKVANGVYVRNFTKKEIDEYRKNAEEQFFTPYEQITTNTQYYYTLRETGGIITGAYNDGRNLKYNRNIYYRSNFGAESYLLELGFIVNEFDLNNIKYNKAGYVEGIKEAIKNEIEY